MSLKKAKYLVVNMAANRVEWVVELAPGDPVPVGAGEDLRRWDMQTQESIRRLQWPYDLVGEYDACMSEAKAREAVAGPLDEEPRGEGAEEPLDLAQRREDRWAHRSAGMVCRTCMWFVVKKASAPPAQGEFALRERLGRCRRHAPTLGGWPAVFTGDWCGDHKLDENKL